MDPLTLFVAMLMASMPGMVAGLVSGECKMPGTKLGKMSKKCLPSLVGVFYAWTPFLPPYEVKFAVAGILGMGFVAFLVRVETLMDQNGWDYCGEDDPVFEAEKKIARHALSAASEASPVAVPVLWSDAAFVPSRTLGPAT